MCGLKAHWKYGWNWPAKIWNHNVKFWNQPRPDSAEGDFKTELGDFKSEQADFKWNHPCAKFWYKLRRFSAKGYFKILHRVISSIYHEVCCKVNWKSLKNVQSRQLAAETGHFESSFNSLSNRLNGILGHIFRGTWGTTHLLVNYSMTQTIVGYKHWIEFPSMLQILILCIFPVNSKYCACAIITICACVDIQVISLFAWLFVEELSNILQPGCKF